RCNESRGENPAGETHTETDRRHQADLRDHQTHHPRWPRPKGQANPDLPGPLHDTVGEDAIKPHRGQGLSTRVVEDQPAVPETPLKKDRNYKGGLRIVAS